MPVRQWRNKPGMNSEAEDSQSRDGESGGNPVGGMGVPWYLPSEDDGGGDEDFSTPETEVDAHPGGGGIPAKVNQEILRVWCPECGQELNILREHLGMQGICLNCNLPIVAGMSPDDGGRMRVVASKVAALHATEAGGGDLDAVPSLGLGDGLEDLPGPPTGKTEGSIGVEDEDETGGLLVTGEEASSLDESAEEGRAPLDDQQDGEGSAEDEALEPLEEGRGPSDDQQDGEESAEDEAEGKMGDDEPGRTTDSREVEGEEDSADELEEEEGAADEAEDTESSGSGGGDEGEPGGLDDPDGPEAEVSEKSEDGDMDSGPSWAKGGNPWDALGLEERKDGESLEGKEEAEDGKGDGGGDPQKGLQGEEDSKPDEVDLEEDLDLDDEEASGSKAGGGEGQEDSDEDLDGETEVLEQEDSRLGLIVAVAIILIVGGGGLTLYLKPNLIRGSSTDKDKAPTEEFAKSAKSAKSDKSEITGKSGNNGAEVTTGLADETDKTDKAVGDKVELASREPKAIKRPEGKNTKPDSEAGEKPVEKSEPKPEMARARANVDDEVALRMHQEGERAIRSFYRAQSIEERSAFVLDPGRAVGSMRSFYEKLGKLPTIRYLEFKGKILDPTSGLRFGVFDVHEKENERSHRWIVVEVEPGQYALDWGLYEQLENSTLVSYLAKEQSAPKEFRLLMKLGDRVSAVDNPWDEDAVKVYLQLPSAGDVEGEVVLLRKSVAQKLGILDGLGDGKIRIGRLTLDWIAGDKDPGSKAPTITGFDGWGAWTQMKMRGLN